VETSTLSPNQGQITFLQPIHNMYLFHDQDDIHNDESIHEPLDPIHLPITIHEKTIQIKPIHNIYLLYDQDDTYEEATHEHLDPIHNPILIHEQDIQIAPSHPPSSPIHNEQTSTCHDDTLVPQVSIKDPINNLDLSEHNDNQYPNDPSSISTIDPVSKPSCPISLSTLIHECSLRQQQPLSTSLSPSNNELKSNVQSTPSPIVHRILQNMNY